MSEPRHEATRPPEQEALISGGRRFFKNSMGSITSRRTSIHECDADLLCRANRILERRKLDLADAARLERAIDNYEIALRLARGPVPDRSQHWSEQAKRLWAELDDLVWGLT